MAFRDFVYLVHFAGDSCIVDRHNHLCLFGNRIFDKLFVQVHRIGANVNKNAFCPLRYKRIRSAHERERRHNHLVAGSDIAETGGHFESVGTTSGQKRLRGPRMFLKPLVTTQIKCTITTNLAAFYSLFDIIELQPHKRRLVERNLCHTRNINFILPSGLSSNKKSPKKTLINSAPHMAPNDDRI